MLALTGGTGFVGQAVLDEAGRRRLSVRALARREQPAREGVTWVRGDLADAAALGALVEGADAALHVAGAVNAPDAAAFHDANVAGTERLIEAARTAGVGRLVFVSSLAAREPSLSAYGRSKRHAEEAVQTSGLDWTIVRPPAIYGPRDREMLDLFRAARFGVMPMPPAGRASMIHVDDLARLLLDLVEGSTATHERIYEPDDGHAGGWSHAEMAKMIGAAVGRRVWAPAMPAAMLRIGARLDSALRGQAAKLTADRVGYMVHPDWVCRSDKVPPAELWQPQVETREGLRDTADWYRSQGWL